MNFQIIFENWKKMYRGFCKKTDGTTFLNIDNNINVFWEPNYNDLIEGSCDTKKVSFAS